MFDRTTYEIKAHIGTIAERELNGEKYTKEVNLVSWNGRPAVIDVREWNSDHTKMSKGISFTDAETEQVCMILHNYMRERSK